MKGKVKKARIDAWPSRKHLENRVKQVEAEMTLRRLDALLEWMPPAPSGFAVRTIGHDRDGG